MKWTRASPTEFVSTPLFVGTADDVLDAVTVECEHDWEDDTRSIPQDDIPKGALMHADRCNKCVGTRFRITGEEEVLDKIFKQCKLPMS